MSVSESLIVAAQGLREEADGLAFSEPVRYVYNPLSYAWTPYQHYLSRYGTDPRKVVFVGMNPGPWGMAQTGVPFGDVEWVRDWLGIEAPVGKPPVEHPKRLVEGFACPRRETSGCRLWGWARDIAGSASTFFSRFFVANYCPLLFLEESGRNRTPDRLPFHERVALFQMCDRHLLRAISALDPHWVIGVGRFAERRVEEAVSGQTASRKAGSIITGGIPHPSPASPQANRDWSNLARRRLEELGVPLEF